MLELLEEMEKTLSETNTFAYTGYVYKIHGLLIESKGPMAYVGELCEIEVNQKKILAEVIGFENECVKLMPYHPVSGIQAGARVRALGLSLKIPLSYSLLGRVMDGAGSPIDGKGILKGAHPQSIFNQAPGVLDRIPVKKQIQTHIRALDGFLPVGEGQRIGIFAGSGVGKSSLLGMIARNTSADVNVIALVGERGREVKEFIEENLGEEGLKKTVLIVSTSDASPLMRVRSAFVAMTIAEFFRDEGKNVLFLFDSLTRLALAQRELGIAVGEHASARGYTPSVFELLPKILERCSNSALGTITGFYTVLVEGDDLDEPITDTVRGILDGHVILNRKMAERGIFPAVDILKSLSRLELKLVSGEHYGLFQKMRRLLSIYRDSEDLIQAGVYIKGSSKEVDEAIEKTGKIEQFIAQALNEKIPAEEIFKRAQEIVGTV